MAALLLPELVDLDREYCSRGLHNFIRAAWHVVQPGVDFVDGWHLGLECEYLEAFVDGEIPKLIINVPPGHMKSLGCSVFLHPWVWGPRGMPTRRFVNTSFREDLALRDAIASRDLITSDWYAERWGVDLRRDRNKAHRYYNVDGGYRFSCPVSGIMGEGGDYVILDDPHNVEVAESDTVRDEVVRRLSLAMPTRVRGNKGGFLVIMQRLHKKDYSGHLLAEMEGAVHLCLPARFEYDHPHVTLPQTLKSGRELSGDRRVDPKLYAEYKTLRDRYEVTHDQEDLRVATVFAAKHNGELLWPNLYDEEKLQALESGTALGQYGTAGQLQQRPSPREGGIFKREWFQRYCLPEEVPPLVAEVRGWDLAGSDRKKSPYTAGVRMGMAADGAIYVRHACREQLDAGLVRAYVARTTREDGYAVAVDVPQDPGQAGKGQVRDYQKELRGYRLHWSPESGSKITRAETFVPECKANNVVIVEGPWNQPYLDEMCEFPTGDFMDWTDATSRAYGRLVQLTGIIGDAVAGGVLIEG